MIQSIAAGEAVLSQDEQEVGVVLADIGEGTTDIIIYRGGNPWYSSVIPVGGFQVTRDLAVALGGAPHPIAEKLKQEYGHAIPGTLNASEEIPIPAFFGKAPGSVPRKNLCEPIHDRAVELLELVRDRIRLAGLRDLLLGAWCSPGGRRSYQGWRTWQSASSTALSESGLPAGSRDFRVTFASQPIRQASVCYSGVSSTKETADQGKALSQPRARVVGSWAGCFIWAGVGNKEPHPYKEGPMTSDGSQSIDQFEAFAESLANLGTNGRKLGSRSSRCWVSEAVAATRLPVCTRTA